MSQARVFALKFAAVLTGIVGGFVIAELLAFIYFWQLDGEIIPVPDRLKQEKNTYIQEVIGKDRKCGYADTLFPHPYLAFVHHGNEPCGIPWINNIGLYGEDFPITKRDDRYVILLTGGSVAAQFGQSSPYGPHFLEDILNERYVSETGKPFLVLNGGDGAWKYPQQLILFAIWSDVVDAVVTLDGFNEHYQFTSWRRFEYPASNFVQVNPMATGNPYPLLAAYVNTVIYHQTRQSWLFSHSHLAYGLSFLVRKIIENFAVMASSSERKTTIDSIFMLPTDWTDKQRADYALRKYQHYLRMMDGLAKISGVRNAHFIQPVPAIDKPLTDQEKQTAGDLGYRDIYRFMTDGLLVLQDEGIPVFSLLDIFAGNETTLYADHVHLIREANADSRGYRIMADRMAENLAEAWHLETRK